MQDSPGRLALMAAHKREVTIRASLGVIKGVQGIPPPTQ